MTTISVPAPSRLASGYRALGWVGVTSLVTLLVVVSAVLIGPMIWTIDPDKTDMARQFAPFSAQHPLGTDDFGRDILARLLHGGRLSLAGAGIILVGESVIGITVGAVAGIVGGRVDTVLSRLVDALLALPSLVVALALVGAMGKSFTNIIIALIITGWPWYARAYRGLFLLERRREYVEAARAIGVPLPLIVIRHVLPNVAGPLVVLLTVNLGAAILNLTSLSFLGLGVQAPQSEWGAMVNYGRVYFQTDPWIIAAPGLAIAITVVAVNLLGDALRDHLDPRQVAPRSVLRPPKR
ncbi:ABC transporter permease [Jiangella asiatica]|uniref:ABC transporter permease n=1 Tax=Jiangella asiatica TaxID=2530372 RepID=A0A4V2Z3H3_9ACTN|nr:ABC transporter permease [Jiangella asiatica]TDE12168.1 ABC transporter permease [Jiangella asiatica]